MSELTQEYIDDLFLTAHMADRTHDHRKELEYAQSLQARYNRLTGVGEQYTLYFPVGDGVYDTMEKVETKGYKAKSVDDALNQIEKFFGGKL